MHDASALQGQSICLVWHLSLSPPPSFPAHRICPMPWMQLKLQTSLAFTLFVIATGTSRPHALQVVTVSTRDWIGYHSSWSNRSDVIYACQCSTAFRPLLFIILAIIKMTKHYILYVFFFLFCCDCCVKCKFYACLYTSCMYCLCQPLKIEVTKCANGSTMWCALIRIRPFHSTNVVVYRICWLDG